MVLLLLLQVRTPVRQFEMGAHPSDESNCTKYIELTERTRFVHPSIFLRNRAVADTRAAAGVGGHIVGLDAEVEACVYRSNEILFQWVASKAV